MMMNDLSLRRSEKTGKKLGNIASISLTWEKAHSHTFTCFVCVRYVPVKCRSLSETTKCILPHWAKRRRRVAHTRIHLHLIGSLTRFSIDSQFNHHHDDHHDDDDIWFSCHQSWVIMIIIAGGEDVWGEERNNLHLARLQSFCLQVAIIIGAILKNSCCVPVCWIALSLAEMERSIHLKDLSLNWAYYLHTLSDTWWWSICLPYFFTINKPYDPLDKAIKGWNGIFHTMANEGAMGLSVENRLGNPFWTSSSCIIIIVSLRDRTDW